MIEKAVIDRFEGDMAVLQVGDKERQLVVPRKNLPSRVKEGQWLMVELAGETLLGATIDDEETGKAKARIAAKLAKLRRGEHF